ncbi:glycosyl hydrolase family 8 [Piscinibacter terrae]|uniref:cellulase n=1 Tax=Piscinibacter terrae TaxID=2496871 RepID=A0A3N7HLL8_9BURK|nr:glycosyl hydrolase family 8 [Albitalea terrae]RQP23000.1 hypothetical protein DZC73_17875 [Albitalea terrae]
MSKTFWTTIALAAAMHAATAANRAFPFETNYGLNRPNHAAADTTAERAADIRAYYQQWVSDYLKKVTIGGKDHYYVLGPVTGPTGDDLPPGFSGNPISASEHTGYGMLLTVLMEGQDSAHSERPRFDGLVRTYQRFRSSGCGQAGCTTSLMSSALPPEADWTKNPVPVDDSATDGDMDIALALLMADAQWGSTGAGATFNYKAMAKTLIDDIIKWNLQWSSSEGAGLFRMNMGDWVHGYPDLHEEDWAGGMHVNGDADSTDVFPKFLLSTTRPSDWMMGHWQVFQTKFSGPVPTLPAASNGAQWTYANVSSAVRTEIRRMHSKYFDGNYSGGVYGTPMADPSWTKGLVPDFVSPKVTGSSSSTTYSTTDVVRSPNGMIDEPFPSGQFSENACRVPWRVTWDIMASGHGDSRLWARDIAKFAIGATASGGTYDWTRIGSTYDLNGTRINSFTYFDTALNKTVTKTFGHGPHFAAMLATTLGTINSGSGDSQDMQAKAQAALNEAWKYMRVRHTGPTPATNDGYFKDTLTLFSLLTIANLVWFPE